MEKIRSFIAVDIPGNVKNLLSDLIASLKSVNSISVKWVEPENLHITLKFLGDIDTSSIGPLNGVLADAAAGFSPLMLEVNSLGMFPNERRPRVVWAGLSGDIEKLTDLQQKIENGLGKLGFTIESRKFSPHLTIGRIRDGVSASEQLKFGQVIKQTTVAPETFAVESVNLMKSQLTRQGPIYTRLGSIRLE